MIIQYLVEKGVNIGAKDWEEKIPLHIACQNGFLPVVQYLVEKGANIEAKDKNKKNLLCIASQNVRKHILH